jgi:RES domain-containing protein
MRIWRICRERYAAEAFTGEGARRFGGRWNARGVSVVYASTSLALAAIELFVHFEPNQAPNDLVSIAAELPTAEPALRWDRTTLPAHWWSDELAPMRDLGDRWVSALESLAVLVPSIPIRGDWNLLINPHHPRIAELNVGAPERFEFDARMFTGPGPDAPLS